MRAHIESTSELVSLSYRFAIEVPDFRGLEPDIALHYSSPRKTKTGGLYQGWLGYGWGLAGFDVIERARRGVPAYDDDDIFLINGVELIDCSPGSQSPSCMVGGHACDAERELSEGPLRLCG